MSVASLQFLAALLLVGTTFFYLPHLRWRQAAIAICNAGFLYLLIPNAASWVALGLFLLTGYAVALVLIKLPSRAILTVYLVALVAAFLILRKYDLITSHLPRSIAEHTISIVGLSYMLFRQIHFTVDAMEGQIERMSLWGYANYQLNLFSLLSGPIARYQDFDDHWQGLRPINTDTYSVQTAVLRLLIGVIKLAVIATFFMTLYQKSASALIQADTTGTVLSKGAAIGHLLAVFYFFPIYLYLNFSGYCDIVIAGATFVGLKLPENFDQPYLARNVIDFWTRFHRTLGFWIRDYLFLPLYKGIAERWSKRAESLAFLCYFVAFFLAGVWHGPTTNFVVYGLLQAIGVSATKLWERHIIKRRGRAGLKQYMQSSRVRFFSILATLHFECFSLLFFPVDVGTTFQMLRAAFKAAI